MKKKRFGIQCASDSEVSTAITKYTKTKRSKVYKRAISKEKKKAKSNDHIIDHQTAHKTGEEGASPPLLLPQLPPVQKAPSISS